MTIRLLQHKTLYRDERFFSAFPNVVTLPEGDVLLAFRRAPDHRWMFGQANEEDFDSVDHWHFRSHIAVRRFDGGIEPIDEARSLPAHAEAGDQDANLFLTRSGKLLQYGFLWYPVTSVTAGHLEELGKPLYRRVGEGEGYLYWGSYVRSSMDSGNSWSPHRMMPAWPDAKAPAYKYQPKGAALRGRMVQLASGNLLVAGYLGDVCGTPECTVQLFMSDDEGETWSLAPERIMMDQVHLQEPALALWPKGALTVFNRTDGNKDRLVIAQSLDDGETFDLPRTMEIKGHPFDPLVLPDGRLLLVYGYRHEPMGVRARLVEPGQPLQEAKEHVIRDDSPSRDTGYPSATLLADGRILIAYYITDETGVRGIEGTLIEID